MTLTSDEMAWINANEDLVRELINKSKRAAGDSSRIEIADPVKSAAYDLAASLRSIIGQIEDKIADEKKRYENFAKIVTNIENPHKDTLDSLSDWRTRMEENVAKYEKHQKALTAKIETIEADPLNVFLPLGTVVRFTDAAVYENSLSLSDSTGKSYPVAESIGVVTRLNHSGEFPISVSLRSKFRDGYESEYAPDYERVPTFFVDRSKVEVIGYSLLPNGEEYKGYGFVATHATEDEDAPEMVLSQGGFFWRYHDFGGQQAMELLQAFESMDEMPWVKEPITK